MAHRVPRSPASSSRRVDLGESPARPDRVRRLHQHRDPDLIALPATGVIDVKLSAIGATGLDVTSFALDVERTKLDRVAAQPITLSS